MLTYHSETGEEYKNLTLSLIFTKDSFFYGIFGDDGKLVLKEADSVNLSEADPFEFEKECLQFIAKKTLDQNRYKTVHVSIFDGRFTLIHEDLFEYGEESSYVRNLLSERKQHRIKSRYVNGSQHWCVYTFEVLMENNLLSIFPQATFTHSVMDLLQLVFAKQVKNAVCFYILEKELLIVAIKDSSLQFANFYSIVSREDVLYHLVNAYKTADLDPNIHDLFYAGEINEPTELYTLLYNYIRNIKVLNAMEKVPSQQQIFLK